MSEEKVPREAVKETQEQTATTDQPGAGPPSGDSDPDKDRDRDRTGDD